MSSGRRVMITGAGGFVGSNLVETLASAGCHVIAQDRAFDPDLAAAWRGGQAGRVELTQAPLENLPLLEVDDVIHAAAITAGPDEAGQTPEANLRANLDPLLAVLEWAARTPVRRVVVLSSSAVYRATAAGPVVETMPASPLGLYAVAKHTAENLAETLRREYGRDVVAVRLSNIYGPYERSRATRPRVSPVARLVRAALDEGELVIYRDDPARDWTFAPDIGRALLRLLEASDLQHPLYHVAAGQVLTPAMIVDTLRGILPALRVEVRAGMSPREPRLTRLGALDSGRLRRETGFGDWTPFEQGLRAVVEWQRQMEVAS